MQKVVSSSLITRSSKAPPSAGLFLGRTATPCRMRAVPQVVISVVSDMLGFAMVEPAPFRLPPAPERAELVAKYFRAFGDPTRVRMLELLREEGELTVNELVERLALPQSTVSTHLSCLRWCGFVTTRREHRLVFSRIADPRVREMLDLAHALLDGNADHVASCCVIDRPEKRRSTARV
jgi:ArsR family transcriptional regulator, cadmium/lead-responsive transcriptional repressor